MEEGDLKSLSPSTNSEGLSEEEEKILLEKEFDDYYEDRVHKSAGPVVFLSKSMAMLPVIWTDDEAESECKTYFNLYTFVVFLAWFGLAVIAALRVCKMDNEITWPCDNATALMGVFPIINWPKPCARQRNILFCAGAFSLSLSTVILIVH